MHADVYEVESLAKGRSYIAGLDHFDLRHTGSVSADTLLSTPHISLYAFDDAGRHAVLVETPPDVDLTAAPFYYLAQKEHARRVFTVPYETFNELARALPDPAHLILLYSVGRCGSTLLCKALEKLGDVTTLSEPDAYTHIAGMRSPDGSRDRELTELARSATRFLQREKTSRQATLILKFRSQCIEMADLLHKACPDAHALFLVRDFAGWTRSMGRLSKIHDPDREASYQKSKSNPTMFNYPRDRYISLLRAEPTPPKTRLEDIALHWTSVTKRFLDLRERSVIPYSLTYDDLTQHPESSLRAVAQAFHLPIDKLEAALEVFKHDSQAGTELSGRTLREQKMYELGAKDIQSAEAVALRHGLNPDIAAHLPGHLLSG